jgi:hypothetical protein
MIRRGLTADGTDPGMRGVTRYVRLPVGSNTKAKYGVGGFLHVLHEWHPELRHSPAALGNRMGFDLLAAAAARRRAQEQLMEGLKGERGQDALLAALAHIGLVKHGTERADRVEITCPFLDQHTSNADTGTAYMFGGGGIACHHGHCVKRQRGEYVKRICEELGKLATPEAEAAIYNLTSVADVRRRMFSEAAGARRRGEADYRERIIRIGEAEGMERAVAELNASEMIAKVLASDGPARPREVKAIWNKQTKQYEFQDSEEGM